MRRSFAIIIPTCEFAANALINVIKSRGPQRGNMTYEISKSQEISGQPTLSSKGVNVNNELTPRNDFDERRMQIRHSLLGEHVHRRRTIRPNYSFVGILTMVWPRLSKISLRFLRFRNKTSQDFA